jgi:glycosyltransferase involved in cell wall biosynthesis
MNFSIIIPTYNRKEFLLQAIHSCLNQSYENFEVIIIDDGSTDGTAGVMEDINDRRVKYIYTTNVERGAARNIGIRQAQGDYITFLDSDDIYYKGYLESAKDFILLHQFPKFFHQAFEFVNQEGEVIERYKPFKAEDLLVGNYLACMGVFIHASVAKENLFNENRVLAGSEDYELWLRIYAKHGILISPKVSSAMVSHTHRSELNIKTDKLKARVDYLISTLTSNTELTQQLGKNIDCVVSNIYFYEAINLLIVKDRIPSLIAFINALRRDKNAFKNKKAFSYVYNFIKIGIFGIVNIN